MNKIKIIKKIITSVLVGTLIVVCIAGCGKNTVEYVDADSESTENTQVEEQMKESEQKDSGIEENLLYIYVCGAITNPGVYTLPEGSRICDLFEVAGGFTRDAAVDYWNQARPLMDGEMIYVPTVEEAGEREFSSGTFDQQDTDDGKVNINTASKDVLMTIPGIGEIKAMAIIAYREANGDFTSVEQVKNVEGIKEGVYSKMKDYIKIN